MIRAALVVLALPLAACVSTGTLGIVTKSGADPTDLITGAHPYEEIGPVAAQACRYFALAVIPFGDSAFSTAVDKALAQTGGDALLNVTVSSSLFGFVPYYNIFSYTCTSVKGTAIRFEAARGEAHP